MRFTASRWGAIPPPIYLPAGDVLAMYEGFLSLYKNGDVSFDQTYNDVCVALQSPDLRGEAKGPADDLARPILSMLGGNAR